MQHILFEDSSHFDLLPLTFTRPVYDLRVGIDKLSEKWNRALSQSLKSYAFDYLGAQFNRLDPSAESFWFNGKFIPTEEWAVALRAQLQPGTFLVNDQEEVLAFQTNALSLGTFDGIVSAELLSSRGLTSRMAELPHVDAIRFPWDIFSLNGKVLRQDFAALTANRESAEIDDPHTIVYGRENIFLEPGVKIRAAVLNAEDGPIYIGEGAEIQEGAMVHGAHAICAHAVLSMGAKMRGDTTVGPYSKVGGEVGNSVIQGYSNKGHDGYLGNSVLGYWCNLGADTNTSNLKNNYSEVRLWNYRQGRFVKTGQMFLGLIMGDHSKCGINTMFNTGTVVGVSANIFGTGYPRNFIPSFSWGGAAGLTTYQLPKVLEVAEAVMARRKTELTEEDKAVLGHIFDATAAHRRWEQQAES